MEFIRRKAFSLEYSFTSLKEAEDHLARILKKLNQRYHHEHKVRHLELLDKEKVVSQPATMAPFDSAELIEWRVD